MRTGLNQRGFSLVELAVVLTVLGFVAVGLVSYRVSLEKERVAEQQRDLMVRAEQSLVAFLYRTGRLPCPAPDDGGAEDCGGGRQKGFLPWRTLGLPDRAAGELRYGVYRDSSADADLARGDADRFRPLMINRSGRPTEANLGNANLVDTCFALDIAADAAFSDGRLRISDDEGAANVAYAIAAPGFRDADGDGSRFDGSNPSSDAVFDRPTEGAAFDNDDRVAVAGFDALQGYFRCGEALAAIGHTHFNAAASARMMAITVNEYATLLRLQRRQAEASAVGASAGVAQAAGGIANAVALTTLGVAQAIGSYGAFSYVVAAGVTAIVANTAATVTAAVELGVAIKGVTEAKKREDRVNALAPDANGLADAVDDSAEAADARGF